MLYRFVVCLLVVLLAREAMGQTDTVQLRQFKVVASRVAVPDAFTALAFDSTTLAQQSFSDLGDLLSAASPVYIKDYGVSGISTISLRGTGASHTQLYWNGLPLNSPMLGLVDVSLMPVALLDNIELHQGAGSLIDGSGGLGGSIQMASSPSWSNRHSVLFQSMAGSFDTYKQQARLKWGGNKWQFHTSIYHHQAKNDFQYRDYHNDNRLMRRTNAETLQKGGMQEIYHRLNEKNQLGLRFWYFQSQRNLPPVLGALSKAEEQNDNGMRGMLEWRRIMNKATLEMRAGAFRDELDYFNDTLRIKSKSTYRVFHYYSRYTRYFTDRLKGLMQLQLREEQAESSGFVKQHNQHFSALLVGASWSPLANRLTLDVYSRQELDANQSFYWLPSIGARYRIFAEKEWYWKANAAHNVHFPTLNDLYWDQLGNPDLEVEQSRTLETGLTGENQPLGKVHRLQLGSSVFYALVDNWIIWQPIGGVWRPDNLRKVENKGVELFLDLKSYLKKVELATHINYSYTVSKQLATDGLQEEVVGKQLIYVPNHNVNANLSWKVGKWSGMYSHGYQDRVYINADNSRYLPYFAIADLAVGRNFPISKGKLFLQFRINNLYNEVYQVVAERPMPGRNYAVHLSYQLKK